MRDDSRADREGYLPLSDLDTSINRTEIQLAITHQSSSITGGGNDGGDISGARAASVRPRPATRTKVTVKVTLEKRPAQEESHSADVDINNARVTARHAPRALNPGVIVDLVQQ